MMLVVHSVWEISVSKYNTKTKAGKSQEEDPIFSRLVEKSFGHADLDE